MTDEPLPPEFQFGKVVGRVIRAVADTADDIDALPQARPATGSVTFTPRQSLRVITTPGDKTFVTAAAETVNLSAAGRVIDAEGRQGIWLVTGTYDVKFDLTGGMGLPSMVIEVTTDHTDDAPLDLVDDASYAPPPRTPVQTLQVPLGGTDGYALVRSGSELAWAAIPSPSDNVPQPLGTAGPGTGAAYSRDDHEHRMPSATDVGSIQVVVYGTDPNVPRPAGAAIVAWAGDPSVEPANATGLYDFRIPPNGA